MLKRNYQQEMQASMCEIKEGTKLLLHSCCGPCSSFVLEQLSKHFAVSLLYYNPNIWPVAEYSRRYEEQRSLFEKLPVKYPVTFVKAPYNPEVFVKITHGLESEQEGGARCTACFALRLNYAAETAKNMGIEWFASTLSISPHKNAPLLNEIGENMAVKHNIKFLPNDFKKENGFKRSLELTAEYGMYRQNYCGCEYSYAAREKQKNKKVDICSEVVEKKE